MLKIVHTPSSVDDFFRSLTSEFHWNHADYFQDEVLAMAVAADGTVPSAFPSKGTVPFYRAASRRR